MPPQEDFAEKVIQSLKKNQRAVDLTEPAVVDEVVNKVVAQSDFEAKGAQDAGGDGPITGGNKDINIVPGYGGVAATSVSQINFYWNSPAIPDTSGFGQSVRTTIFNYASSATNPLLVIGGYNGSTNYLPSQTWGGAGAGTTAKIFIDPFRGHITLDYVDLNTSGIASTTRTGSVWYDTAASRVRVGTGAATAKTFAYTDDLVSATSVSIAAATGFTVLYPAFSNVSSSSAGVALSVDVDVNYNPLLNLFTVPVITGTAATFTNFTGNLIGTATTAQNINVATSGAVTGPFYFAMVNTGTGSGLALSTDTNLSYNAAADVLTVANISGTAITGTSLSGKHFGDAAGTAATYTTVFASLVGTATTAQNVNVATTNNVAGVFYLPLLNSATGSGVALSTDTALSYNSAVDVLTVTNISGTAITGTSLSGKHFGDAAGTAATYTTVFASLVGTATTAQNVNVATTNNVAGVFYLPLLNSATGSGLALSSDTALSYNSAVDVLTVTNISGTAITATSFSGTFYGTIAGSATTAQNINVASAANAVGPFYLTMSNAATGSGVALSTDTALSYNSAVDVLTVTNISGTAITGTSLAGKHFGDAAGTAATYTTVFASLTGTATTAQNVNVATTNNVAGVFYLPLLNSATGSGLALSTDTALSYNSAVDVLTVTNISGTAITATSLSGTHFGSLTGTATTAQNVNLASAANAVGPFYFTMSTSSTGSGVALSTDTALSYNAAVDVLTVANISGTAITATSFSGPLSGTATTAQNINVVNASTSAAIHYLHFSPSATGTGLATSSGTALSYIPDTGLLGAGRFTANGVRIGNASNTIDTFSGNLILNAAGGTVTVSGNLNVTGNTITVDSTVSTLVDPVFVLGSGAGGSHNNVVDTADRGIEYRRFSGSAITGFFGFSAASGKFTFIPNANVTAANTYSGTIGVIDANISGSAVTATTGTFTNLTGTLTGNVTGNLTGTATTAQNVNVATTNNVAGVFYIPLINAATGSGVALSSDTALSYNSAVDVLTVTNISGTAITATSFSGTFYGTIAGSAQTAQNINLATTANAVGPFYLTMSNAATGSGVALSSDTALSYNSAVDVLTVVNISGTAITGTSLAGKHFGDAAGTAATYTTVFASLVGTATTAQNVNVATTNNVAGVFYLPLLNAATGSGLALSTDTALSYNSAVDVLTVTNISGTAITASTSFSGPLTGNVTGNLTGTATTAQNVNVATSGAVTGPFYFTMVNTGTGSGLALSTDTALSYNAAVDVLTVTNISGTAITGTSLSGKHFGDAAGTAATYTTVFASLVGTATTAQNVNVASTNNVAGVFYIPLLNNSTGSGLALSTDTALSYNSAVDVLTVTNISGTAITATSISGTHFGSFTGTATTAQNINVASAANAVGPFYLAMTNTATGSGVALSTDTALAYNSAVDVLTVTNISGTAITGTSLAGKHFGDAAGTAATYTTVFASLVGTATTAQNVNVASTNNVAGVFYLSLLNAATGSGLALSTDTALSYNSAVDVLTVTNISGTAITASTFSGSFSGSATTAQNLNVVAANVAGAHYLLMSPSASGSGIAVSSDASLSYVPSTDTLSLANLSGLGVTLSVSSALAQGTYFTIKTTGSDDNSTDDFFIRGLNSSNQSKFSVDANGNLRATTKSFDIPHPTKEGLRLVYGVLEGPEHGVYHRGTVEGKGNIKVQLPEYWSRLVSSDYSVHLTTWGNYSAHIIEKTEDYFTISISSNVLVKALKNIKVDYIVHGSRLDAVLVTEQDA
jgi:capsular polysaccharide biosynthesis protein